MKKLYFIFFIFLYSCISTTAQAPPISINKDKEFEFLMNKIKQTQELSSEMQKMAEDKQAKIVEKTITKIVDLKNEVNELKEVISTINNDTNNKFKLLPISGS